MTNSIAAQAKPSLKFGWVLGCRNDMLFIFGPTLVTYAIFAWFARQSEAGAVFLLATILYAVNVFHQGATWFHYFDRRNRSYYLSKEKWMWYVATPILVLAGTLLLAKFCMPALIFIFIVWGIQHVVQQNMGILLLYHNHDSGEAIVNRNLEVRTQHAGAVFFTAIFFARLFIRDALPPQVVNGVILATFLFFAVSVAQYVIDLSSQVRRGAQLNVPALLFWLVAVLFLLPTAFWGSSYQLAILVPSFLHWMQYIGVNLVLVERKYEDAVQTENLPFNRPMLLFLGFCTLLVAVQFGSITYGSMLAEQRNFWSAMYMGLGMVHYALDGCIWKFREPFNRKNILPFLVKR